MNIFKIYVQNKARMYKFGKDDLFMEVEKHLILTGSSEISWKDAIVKTINEASKSIDYLHSVKVLEQRASIEGNKISEYFVDLDLGFILDLNRK